MKRLLKGSGLVLLILILFLAGCNSDKGGEEGSAKQDKKISIEGVPERFADGESVNIKVIRKIGGDDHTAQFLAGAKEEGEALGFNVETYTANGNTAKFHDAINQAADDDKIDGVILSHGDDDATFAAVEKLVDSGKKVVAFDSIGELTKLENVTLTSQDDEALAKLALEQIKDDFKGEAKIAYLWVDGFPPMVKRNAIYEKFLKDNPGIKEVERFGVASEDTSVQTLNAVSAMLNKLPKGELDAIFATWDAFAIGATRAIKDAGRDEVKIYGIDVSNADLQIMSEKGSPWKYTAAVDPKLIGSVNMRILAKKIAGEETPETHDLEASLISQEQLQKSGELVNMENLKSVVDGWGVSDAFLEPWMEKLKVYYKNN